ncbi:radical SAM/SPASM domain-containing protein [Prosthecochloris sp. SCSIO W1103]|uniref:radical SAM/SPASM domain-containing protein n=1 Tax=Prosthecochloris sp. SCSIO W1103 TaxID=2992244 RepID=UPI00223DD858|nr:radical SAM protein [Prosthecochloris sp. SCSIO W1103]UZJ37655.1 radical SAM protein [Prosthecochloris sp. SCSIO W1103]
MVAATEFRDNDILVLSPEYRIRPNAYNCIIYPFDAEDASSWRSMPAVGGVALTLFDGRRTNHEVAQELESLLGLENEKAKELLAFLISHSNSEAGKEYLYHYIPGNGQNSFSTYSTLKFLEKLKGNSLTDIPQGAKLEAPLTLILMPTNNCDVSCRYCYAEKIGPLPNKMLPLAKWFEIIDEAASLEIVAHTFSGGDPLIYPGIDLLFERMALYGMKFLLPTKSFVSKEQASRFHDIGMKELVTIQISVDGTSSVIDELVGCPDYANRAFASIKNLVEQGFYVRTNTVCTPLNYREVPDLVHKLHDLGVKRSSITNYARSFYRHDESLFLNEKQIRWVNEQVSRIGSDLGWDDLRANAAIRDFSVPDREEKTADWNDRAYCSGGKSCMVITPNGDVVLCEQVPQRAPFVVGSLREQTITEVWNSPEIDAFVHPSKELFKGTECETCDEFDECHAVYGRCFRDAFFTYQNLYTPSPNCPKAPPGFRMS